MARLVDHMSNASPERSIWATDDEEDVDSNIVNSSGGQSLAAIDFMDSHILPPTCLGQGAVEYFQYAFVI